MTDPSPVHFEAARAWSRPTPPATRSGPFRRGSQARTHYYMCDLDDLHTLLDTRAPAATTFFPGHFGPVPRASVAELAEE